VQTQNADHHSQGIGKLPVVVQNETDACKPEREGQEFEKKYGPPLLSGLGFKKRGQACFIVLFTIRSCEPAKMAISKA
jgi:hypothetical protein